MERSPRPRPAPLIIAALALVTAGLLAFHRQVPGSPGTLLDSFLPWLGLVVLPLALVALLLRTWSGAVVVLVPALVWGVMFGTAWLHRPPGGAHDLRVVTQNLFADSTRQGATAAALVASGADLVGVEELAAGRDAAALSSLSGAFGSHVVRGTVGLWSRWPLTDTRTVDLGMGWTRALRTVAETPRGDVTVYVAHLDSARPDHTAARDDTMHRLATAVRADTSPRLLVIGDLNTASTDRALTALVPPLTDAQRAAGVGLGFTWPSAFPITRPDQVLYRGLHARAAKVLHTPGSDHRAAQADFLL